MTMYSRILRNHWLEMFVTGLILASCASVVRAQGWDAPYRYAAVNGMIPNVVTVNGRTYAIVLQATERAGKFAGDQLGVWDITDRPFGCRNRIELGTQTCNLGGVPIEINFKGGRDNKVEIKIGNRGKFSTKLADIYIWRARSTREDTYCGRTYLVGKQPGSTYGFVFFDPSVSRYLNSGSDVDVSRLSPTYFIPVADTRGPFGDKLPISDTGCWFYRQADGNWRAYQP